MQRMRGRLVFALLVLLVLSACDPPPPHTQKSNTCDCCPREIVPDNWREVVCQKIATDDKPPDEECIVFYRTGDPSETPIDAVMYRLTSEEPPTSSDKTPSFVAYDLYSPYDGHMCECRCEAHRADLLSAYEGTELVIRDKCEEEWTRLFAYRWVTDTLEYQLVAHFDGDRIQMERDRVTVDYYTAGGAELFFRCTYSPRVGAPLFNEESFPEDEIIFPDGLPDDVLASPYPEVVMLAFYSQVPYTDTTVIQEYFADGARELVGQCEDGKCGCTTTASPIARVRVINMEVAESRQLMRPADQYCPPGTAIEKAENWAFVTTEAVCEYQNGSQEPISAIWMLVWEGGGWRLRGPPVPSE